MPLTENMNNIGNGLSDVANKSAPFILLAVTMGLTAWQMSLSKGSESKEHAPHENIWLALTTAEFIKATSALIAAINKQCGTDDDESPSFAEDLLTNVLPPAGWTMGCALASQGTKWGDNLADGYVFSVIFYYAALLKSLKCAGQIREGKAIDKSVAAQAFSLATIATGLMLSLLLGIHKLMILAPIGAFFNLMAVTHDAGERAERQSTLLLQYENTRTANRESDQATGHAVTVDGNTRTANRESDQATGHAVELNHNSGNEPFAGANQRPNL